jgi:BrnA antitoxin of type II toxin-antitoxin system
LIAAEDMPRDSLIYHRRQSNLGAEGSAKFIGPQGEGTSDEGHLAEGWQSTVEIGLPKRKQGVHIRLDTDVLDWFKAHGSGYQTRINAVLRAFVRSRQRTETDEPKVK